MFSFGDRVRWNTTGDDGWPLIRYGFVRSMADPEGPAIVMLDGELGAEVIDVDQLALVSVTAIELRLDGDDLLGDPDLRRGLMALWRAEAESAGLDVDTVNGDGSGQPDGDAGDVWWLAAIASGGERYTLKAMPDTARPGTVWVGAVRFDDVANDRRTG
jgi:hypothetical protein